MSDEIRNAILAFTAHVRVHEQTLVHDTSLPMDEYDQQERVEAKRAVCDLMEDLAERSVTERVTFREFEELRQQNHDVFIAAPSLLIANIAKAFRSSDALDEKNTQ
jgi:hypothetical protein